MLLKAEMTSVISEISTPNSNRIPEMSKNLFPSFTELPKNERLYPGQERNQNFD